MKLRFRKPKIKEKDLKKIRSTIEEIKNCPYCTDLRKEIKNCMESRGVKNNLKSVTWHNLKCKDCRARIMLITECKKKGHQ